MMLGLPQWQAAKTGALALWSSSKWVILVGALALSHYWAYTKGSEKVYKANQVQVAQVVAKEIKKGVDGAKRASEDTITIKDQERDNDDTIRRFEELGNRSGCSFTDDELRFMEDALFPPEQ